MSASQSNWIECERQKGFSYSTSSLRHLNVHVNSYKYGGLSVWCTHGMFVCICLLNDIRWWHFFSCIKCYFFRLACGDLCEHVLRVDSFFFLQIFEFEKLEEEFVCWKWLCWFCIFFFCSHISHFADGMECVFCFQFRPNFSAYLWHLITRPRWTQFGALACIL